MRFTFVVTAAAFVFFLYRFGLDIDDLQLDAAALAEAGVKVVDCAAGGAGLTGSSLTLGLQIGQLRLEVGDLLGVFLDGGAQNDGIIIQLFAVDIEIPVVIAQTNLEFVDRIVGRGDAAVDLAGLQQIVGLVGNILGQLTADLGGVLGQFGGLIGDDLGQFCQFVK